MVPKPTLFFINAAILTLILALVAGIILSFPGGSLVKRLITRAPQLQTCAWLNLLIFGAAFWI